MIETKTDLPQIYKIRKAAETLNAIMPSGHKAVYLIGHGAQRDWRGGIYRIYSEYLNDLTVIFVPQDDVPRPGGYRPIQKNPHKLKVAGATSGLIFDTSSKEFTVVNGIEVPTSSSQSGAWIDILRFAEYLEIPKIFSSVVNDFLGISTVPIDSTYKEKNRYYFGPRKFLELNLVSLGVAASQLRNGTSYEKFRERLIAGDIELKRLHRYEKYLIEKGLYGNDRPLEDVIISNLNLIVEPNTLKQGEDPTHLLSEAMRHV